MLPRPTRFGSVALAAAACAAAAAAAPREARAQSAAEAERRARAEYAAGTAAFARGDYAEAIQHFNVAYAFARRPQLLYNIGTSHDRLHHWREALRFFNQYLAEVPEAPNAAEVRARLQLIQGEIDREERLAAGAGNPVVVVRQGQERVVVRTVPAEPPRPWRVVAITSGGLTVVAGGLAIAIGLFTNGFYNNLRMDCGDRSPMGQGCGSAAIADVTLRASLVNFSIGAAIAFGAVTVGAAALDLLRPREPAAAGAAPTARPTARASVAPAFAPGGTLSGGLLVVTGSL